MIRGRVLNLTANMAPLQRGPRLRGMPALARFRLGLLCAVSCEHPLKGEGLNHLVNPAGSQRLASQDRLPRKAVQAFAVVELHFDDEELAALAKHGGSGFGWGGAYRVHAAFLAGTAGGGSGLRGWNRMIM